MSKKIELGTYGWNPFNPLAYLCPLDPADPHTICGISLRFKKKKKLPQIVLKILSQNPNCKAYLGLPIYQKEIVSYAFNLT